MILEEWREEDPVRLQISELPCLHIRFYKLYWSHPHWIIMYMPSPSDSGVSQLLFLLALPGPDEHSDSKCVGPLTPLSTIACIVIHFVSVLMTGNNLSISCLCSKFVCFSDGDCPCVNGIPQCPVFLSSLMFAFALASLQRNLIVVERW